MDKYLKQRHFLKLGKKRRKSSKRNEHIIFRRVIIKAIITTPLLFPHSHRVVYLSPLPANHSTAHHTRCRGWMSPIYYIKRFNNLLTPSMPCAACTTLPATYRLSHGFLNGDNSDIYSTFFSKWYPFKLPWSEDDVCIHVVSVSNNLRPGLIISACCVLLFRTKESAERQVWKLGSQDFSEH